MYTPVFDRYDYMQYRRCGNSGLQLPAISLGLWHNFGSEDDYEKCRQIVHRAFDTGITHFDLANNYGPPPGAAEITFGKILKQDLQHYRDELIISTKAGWPMWAGPYGDGGSKKYLVASLDQSLKRMGLDYVDVFYHHRPDPDTPLEETMAALHLMVQQGKALYVGISSYSPGETERAAAILQSMGTPLLIHQPKYSMLVRDIEKELLPTLADQQIGCIAFSPLAQGLLTNKYLNGIPLDSRARSNRGNGAIDAEGITPDLVVKLNVLNKVAESRQQSLAQMALSWVLRDERVTSVIIGASRPEQVTDCVTSLRNLSFTPQELQQINEILG
jgi:L-glyceraldehyde 3-phosphate reductase